MTRRKRLAARKRAGRVHAPRRLAGSQASRETKLVPIDSDWHIKSSRPPAEHSKAFGYLMLAEMESGPDALVLDGVLNARREGLPGSMSESSHSIPAGEIGPEPAEVARVMYVNIVDDFHGETVVLGEIGIGLRREGETAELARLRRRFRFA